MTDTALSPTAIEFSIVCRLAGNLRGSRHFMRNSGSDDSFWIRDRPFFGLPIRRSFSPNFLYSFGSLVCLDHGLEFCGWRLCHRSHASEHKSLDDP